MIFHLHGHIGSHVSALVDGQLSAAEEERAWRHILGCPGCRRLVEREGWIKQRIAGLAEPTALKAPAGLLGSLYDVDAWSEVDALERRSARRRATVALVGAGTVGVAVLALLTVSTPPAGRGEVPGPAMIGNGVPPRNDPGTGLSVDIENAAFGGTSR